MVLVRYFSCLIFLFGALAAFEPAHSQGVSVGGTRLIYDAGKREATLPVRNSANSVPHLIQSWVDDFSDPQVKTPFIITPPLFRLDAGKENILRIVFTGETVLPQDRESVFWLNVKAIPAVERTEANQLIIAVKTRIKLFYRPVGLRTDAANHAWEQLTFASDNGGLIIHNPTPYYVSLFSLKAGDQHVAMPPMIAPFSVSFAPMGKADVNGPVTWQAINDYGAITEALTAELVDQAAQTTGRANHGSPSLQPAMAAP